MYQASTPLHCWCRGEDGQVLMGRGVDDIELNFNTCSVHRSTDSKFAEYLLDMAHHMEYEKQAIEDERKYEWDLIEEHFQQLHSMLISFSIKFGGR